MPEFSPIDRLCMKRCLQLASRGGYHVGSNPLVGAVIVHKNRIIGEGYHQIYGGPHAEVNAIGNIHSDELDLLQQSHLYVSLEPCNHYGKTPPCTEALLEAGIPRVTICNLDPNPQMAGKSIELLKLKGVEVRAGLLAEEGRLVNRGYFIRHEEGLPFITLKWAQSADNFFGQRGKQVWLSNETSRLLAHRWREEHDAILVGTNTALTDDPELTNRRGQGRSPHRYVLDRNNRLPPDLSLFTDSHPTTLITSGNDISIQKKNKHVIQLSEDNWNPKEVFKSILRSGHNTILVEGGAQLIRSLIKEGLWHEARIIHTPVVLSEGIKSPNLKGKILKKYSLNQDKVFIISNL